MSRALSFRQVKESPKATSKQGVQKNKKTLSLSLCKATGSKSPFFYTSPIWGKGVVSFFMIFFSVVFFKQLV